MSVHSVSDAKKLPLTPSASASASPTTKKLIRGEGGSRFVDSGPDSVTSFNSLSLGGGLAGQTNYYPRFRKSKVSFVLPEEVKKVEPSKDKKEEIVGDDDEEEEEEEGKKGLKVKGIEEKKVGKSRNGGSGSTSSTSTRVTRQRSKVSGEIPTGLRTQTRSRTANGKEKAVFSLALTKKEIESDFLKMTGQLPPKKPLRRPKNVQNRLDALFPGMYLKTITPETYKLPDPPLKG